MVLLPEMIRLRRAGGDEMRIVPPLGFRIRQIVVGHPAIAAFPGLAAVGGLQHPGGGHRDVHMLRIARVDDDRMNAGFEHTIIDTRRRTAPAVLAGRLAGEQIAAATVVIPQRSVEFPAVAAIVADEQAAGDRAGIHSAGLIGIAEGEIPDLEHGGVLVLRLADRRLRIEIRSRQVFDDVARALRVLQRQHIFPGRTAVTRTRELRPPVSMIQGCPQRTVARITRRVTHGNTRMLDGSRAPGGIRTLEDHGTLARTEQNHVRHKIDLHIIVIVDTKFQSFPAGFLYRWAGFNRSSGRCVNFG